VMNAKKNPGLEGRGFDPENRLAMLRI